MRSRMLVAIAALATAALVAPLALAAVTRGEAQAVLNGYPTAGRTIFFQGSERSNGAPARGAAEIRPFAGTPWDGAHYCKDDWHAIVAAWFDGNEIGGPQSTVPEIRDRLAQVTVSYTLNGNPLETTRTAIRPFLHTSHLGLEDAFAFQQGTVIKFAPGTYTLVVHFSDPVFGDFDTGITIYVDEAACA
jgi:hypothetical protein